MTLPSRITHHASRITHHASPLFVPKRLDRIKIRGLPRRIRAENDSHDRTNKESKNNPIEGDDWSQFKVPGRRVSTEDTEEHTESAANFAKHYRFKNELRH